MNRRGWGGIIPAMRLRSRLRFRIALAVLSCLLFQQVAMAAYACTMTSMPSEPVAMAEGCSQAAQAMAREAPALCAEHCSPDRVVAPEPPAAHVAAALPPVRFAPAVSPPATSRALAVAVPLARSDPPPRLRYCSLLI